LTKTALRIALVTSVALLAPVASAFAAPTATFTVSPDPPVSGQPATYTSTSTADVGASVSKVEWDFNNDGTYDVIDEAAPWTASHTYATPGAKTFVMRVTDNNILVPGVTTDAKTITVAQANRPPTASFDFNPSSPFVGDDVLFASDVSDPDGDTLTFSWNFGDGTPAGTTRNPIHTFASAGSMPVTLTVTDPSGESDTATREVVIRGVLVPGNQLPLVAFAFSPRSPRVGDQVEFVSSTTDPEGDLKEQAWDLDGDGEFDDGRGDEVVYSFTTPGAKVVRQRATDGAGGTAIEQRTLTVAPQPKAKAGFISPSPVISLNAQILSKGARIQVLRVSAPKGALATVKCKGKSCPVKQRRKRVKKGGTVRFKTYERFLRAGTKLEIFVNKSGAIGSYTSYKIRAGKFPVRVRRCTPPGKLVPRRCGSL
jgi:PKD repeat protein